MTQETFQAELEIYFDSIKLENKEREVAKCLLLGYSDTEIKNKTNLYMSSVRYAITRILKKSKSSGRAAFIAKFYIGLLGLDWNVTAVLNQVIQEEKKNFTKTEKTIINHYVEKYDLDKMSVPTLPSGNKAK